MMPHSGMDLPELIQGDHAKYSRIIREAGIKAH